VSTLAPDSSVMASTATQRLWLGDWSRELGGTCNFLLFLFTLYSKFTEVPNPGKVSQMTRPKMPTNKAHRKETPLCMNTSSALYEHELCSERERRGHERHCSLSTGSREGLCHTRRTIISTMKQSLLNVSIVVAAAALSCCDAETQYTLPWWHPEIQWVADNQVSSVTECVVLNAIGTMPTMIFLDLQFAFLLFQSLSLTSYLSIFLPLFVRLVLQGTILLSTMMLLFKRLLVTIPIKDINSSTARGCVLIVLPMPSLHSHTSQLIIKSSSSHYTGLHTRTFEVARKPPRLRSILYI
jgi:hypothetical protein